MDNKRKCIVLSYENMNTRDKVVDLLAKTDTGGVFTEFDLVTHKGVSYTLRSRKAALFLVQEALVFFVDGDCKMTKQLRRAAMLAEGETQILVNALEVFGKSLHNPATTAERHAALEKIPSS